MIAANQIKTATRPVRIRPVALPAEHGGWGLLLEPIVLGLLLAPSLAGLFVSIAALGGFLARHPFKLAAADWRRHRRSTRTVMAKRLAALYFSIAALALALAIKSGGVVFLLPLLFASPFAIMQLFYDSLGHSRALTAELAGSISIGAVATAIAMAGNWPRPLAFGLWAILAARTVPTVLYLRARLRVLRRKPASPRGVIVAHVLAILVLSGLAWVSVVPFLAVGVLIILLLRAVLGFSGLDKQVTAKKLGLREICFGALTVLAVVVGHAAGW